MEATELKAELEGIRDALDEKYGEKYKQLDDMVRELAQKGAQGFSHQTVNGPRETIGQQAIKSEQFQALLRGDAKSARVTLEGSSFFESKNTITGDTGSPASPGDTFSPADRPGGLVPGATRDLKIRDLIPVIPASSNQVAVPFESSFTNAAAGQSAEGETKAESDIEFDLQNRDIVTIATFVRASTQVLADGSGIGLQSYIDSRLRHFLRLKEETQLLSGDGTAGELSGFTLAANHDAFTPTTGDGPIESVRRAITQLQKNEYFPNAVVLHPDDWQTVELSKTDDGAFLLGDGGARQFVARGMNEGLWKLPVIVSNSITSGKVLLGDFSTAILWDRMAPVVELGWTGDDFIKNKIVLRAEERVCLSVPVPLAFAYGDLTV